MSQLTQQKQFKLAFLTAVGTADSGFVGGLLITNQLGRPLEFQCTTPVKPNRTQEILYGPTLDAYILCDLIGRTLIEKIGIPPQLVLVEDPMLLALREQVEVAVGCVEGQGSVARWPSFERESPGSSVESPGPEARRSTQVEQNDERSTFNIQHSTGNERSSPPPLSGPGPSTLDPGSSRLRLGSQLVRIHRDFAVDVSVLEAARQQLPTDADLNEPFSRVREALSETMGVAA